MANIYDEELFLSIQDIKDSIPDEVTGLTDDEITQLSRDAEIYVKQILGEINGRMACGDFKDFLECESEETLKVVKKLQIAMLDAIKNIIAEANEVTIDFADAEKRVKSETSNCGAKVEYSYNDGCATSCRDESDDKIKACLECFRIKGEKIPLCKQKCVTVCDPCNKECNCN